MPIWNLFIALGSDWRIVAYPSGRTRYLGIATPAIESLLRMEGVPDPQDTLRQLKHMERAALHVLNKDRK